MDRNPSPDSTILDRLATYRRRYGESHKNVEEERAPPSTIIAARYLDLESVRKGLLNLQEQAKKGMLAIHNHKGTFNSNTECYELKRKVVYYGKDDPNKINRYIFGRLSLLIDSLLKNLSKNYVCYQSLTSLKYRVRVGYQSCYSAVYSKPPPNQISLALISDDLLRICATLECSRDSLLIMIRDPGYFCGDLRLQVTEKKSVYGLDVAPGGTAGQLIPASRLATMTNIVIGDDVTCMLIIENHSLFNELWQSNHHIRYKCIMVCVSGHPDLLVREFISLISAADQTLPVFCLCDLDLGGYFIVEGLKFGTPTSAFMHASSVCKRLQWIGICPSDISTYELQPDENTDDWFTNEDREKLRSHMAKFEHSLLYWKAELQMMIQLPRKVKLQGDGIADRYPLWKLEDVAQWGD